MFSWKPHTWKGDKNSLFTLNISVASNQTILLCILLELCFSRSSVNQDMQFWILQFLEIWIFLLSFHEVYLFDYLISYYGRSTPMGIDQSKSLHFPSSFRNESMQYLGHFLKNVGYENSLSYSWPCYLH